MDAPAGTPKPSKLSAKQQRFVAAFLGDARGNATEAARLAGYQAAKRATLAEIGRENLKKPDIAAAIAGELASVRREGASVKQLRLDALNERWWLLRRVIDERAARYAAECDDDARQAAKRFWGHDVPAEALTGLLVKKETVSGAGARSIEWSVDVGLLKELREHEKQIAQELGEGATSLNLNVSGRVAHVIQRTDLSMLSDDELDKLAELAAKVGAGEVGG